MRKSTIKVWGIYIPTYVGMAYRDISVVPERKLKSAIDVTSGRC